MKSYSINIRHDTYFKLLALMDLLWDDTFQDSENLSIQHAEILKKAETLIGSLLALAKAQPPQHQQ